MDGAPTGTGIGQPVRRREDLRLLTGNGRYSDDVNLSGQAYAVMVRSPHAHALIRRIDAAVARGDSWRFGRADRRGCGGRRAAAATQHRQQPPSRYQHPEQGRVARIPAAAGRDRRARGLPCRRDRRGCRRGDAARGKGRAERVAVDYEPLPAVTHALLAAEPGASRRVRTAPTSSSTARSATKAATAAAFARAGHVVKFDTWVQRVAGVPMEPRAAIGEFDRADRALHPSRRGRRRGQPTARSRDGVGRADRAVPHGDA